jgi:hypothetical protein
MKWRIWSAMTSSLATEVLTFAPAGERTLARAARRRVLSSHSAYARAVACAVRTMLIVS